MASDSESGASAYPRTPRPATAWSASTTGGGEAKSMSATHSGSTSPSYRSHLKLAVPRRSMGVSKKAASMRLG